MTKMLRGNAPTLYVFILYKRFLFTRKFLLSSAERDFLFVYTYVTIIG